MDTEIPANSDSLNTEFSVLDDNSDHDLEARIAELGFKPQKEIKFNKLLPYSNKLDNESQTMLQDIKGNLGRCVLLKELKPGCITWSFRLQKYIQMFGMKFSKEDHITFINLIYEILIIPRLEPNMIFRFATCLTCLLKKQELISREELVLPWRPLYDICDHLLCSSDSSIGMYRYPSHVEHALAESIAAARVYFEPSATQEMLDLWRPRLCPLDSMGIQGTVELFDSFLPTILLPHERALGYELWFNEFIDLWKICHNSPPWEASMMSLMSRLACNNLGRIDWEPYLPLMYTRIMRSFSLPVYYKKMKLNKNHKLNSTNMNVWIVATLGGGSSSQVYLDRLMKVLESYFHPANNGSWVARPREFLRKLPQYFVQRLYTERHSKPSWIKQIPDKVRLTEEDITRFVQSLAPTVKLAMYSRLTEVSLSLQYLATLRPSLVIPPIIESMYNTLDSLTEPHKYTAAMLSLVSVARPMIEPTEYKAGPTHVIPLLIAVLPGIDPNDIRKCFITFQVITTFTSMIPIVNSSNASEYWKDLTEEEEAVCASTSQLEDFVLEFLDRCFSLVDNSVLETTRLEQNDHNKQQRSRMENVIESAITSTFTCLLGQTEPGIFKSALHKLHSFVTSRILETTVSGKCVASICKTFAKVRPEETLKLLVPHFYQMIMSHAEHEDITKEETLDNELLFNLLLLSEVVHCNAAVMVGYADQLEKVLDQTLHLRCVEGYNLASRLLRNVLSAVAATRPHEFKSSNEDYGKHVSDFLPIREWGKSYETHEVKVEWYTPGEVEIAFAQRLIAKYLVRELDTITQYSTGQLNLTREELQCSLTVVSAFLGCGRLMPVWDEPILTFTETCAQRKHFMVKSATMGCLTMPDGRNVRKTITAVMGQLQVKLFASGEDDIKSLNNLVNILGGVLLNMLPSNEEFEAQSKALCIGKKIFENKLLGKKRHIRSILVNRAFHQHDSILGLSSILPSETHVEIIHRLLELSTSHYSEVRMNAQSKLNTALKLFSDPTMLIPKILEILKLDVNLHHERFKGVLYVLLGPKENPLIVRRHWAVVKELWPALVRSAPSEKPSVINLLNALSDTVHKQFPTLNIDIQIGDTGEETARLLWSSNPVPTLAVPSVEETATGKIKLTAVVESNRADYNHLLNSLLQAIHSNLHWRYHSLALSFLGDLVHPDIAYSPAAIHNILQTLIHDNIEFRKIAIRCTVYVLKQQKRSHKYCIKEVDRSQGPSAFGDRKDNQWLQYNSSTAPRTQQAWDEPRFSHKQYVGYYTWPKEVKVNSSAGEQPALDRSREQLSPGEREVDDFFSDPHRLNRLIAFLSLEEKKGKDKFNGMRFILFKNLFRNHGDKYLELFKPHLERLIADKHESNQRCAAEIITGMIRGAKHWPFDKVQRMWDCLLPLLRTAFTNMTVETINDWSVMAATASENRDPNRHHWLLEFLMEDPLREEASFLDCGRLCALQGALNQQEWRVVELFNRLLQYLTPKLSHPYQLLRERIGSVLTNIFALDLPSTGIKRTQAPHITEFVNSIMPELLCLYSLSDAVTNHVTGSNDATSSTMEVDLPSTPGLDVSDENGKNSAICLLKTMVNWVTNSLVRADFSAVPEFFMFLPLVSLMEHYEADDELNKICSAMLAALSHSLTMPEYVPTALAAVQEVSEMSSWSARGTCLEFLQVFLFHNMAIISSQESWVSQVNSLVLRLLKDERVEVREQAGQVLSGLIHCDFIKDKQQLVNELTRLSTKKTKAGVNEIAKRHAGVLGLCAFISAYPYDVVDPMPQIFTLLGSHLNDPQPIPSSIRKTLGDFKRTHHDNWDQHKLRFTEEQLAVLTDLIVPPSYYA